MLHQEKQDSLEKRLPKINQKRGLSQYCPVKKLHTFSAIFHGAGALVAGSSGSVILLDWR